MSIHHRCPACQALLRAPDELVGKKVRCQKCNQVSLDKQDESQIPVLEAAPPPPQQPQRVEPIEFDERRSEGLTAELSSPEQNGDRVPTARVFPLADEGEKDCPPPARKSKRRFSEDEEE